MSTHDTTRNLEALLRVVLYPIPPKRAVCFFDEKSSHGAPFGFFGPGYIEGTTSIDGTPNLPKSCPVRLVDRKTGQFVREVQSSVTGVYRFDDLKLGVEYQVIAIDDANEHNAVISDRIKASV